MVSNLDATANIEDVYTAKIHFDGTHAYALVEQLKRVTIRYPSYITFIYSYLVLIMLSICRWAWS